MGFVLLLLLLLLRNVFVPICPYLYHCPYLYSPICICFCAFVFVHIYICICPGGPKGPHLVAKGQQPSTGARSLAPVGGQILYFIKITGGYPGLMVHHYFHPPI